MATIPLSLHSGGYKGDSVVLHSQECVNLFPEFLQEDKIALIGTPGLRTITTIGVGPHRGAHKFNGDAYFVSGNQLIKYALDGTKTVIGTLNTSSGNVSMADSGTFGDELLIVDGTDGYICDGSTVTAIVDAQFPANPTRCGFSDGYFVVVEDATGFFYLSDFYDGTSWTTAGKANAERNPDDLATVVINKRLLWLIGEITTEVWWNSGNDFPYDPVQNGVIEWGTMAPASAVDAGDYGAVWLAQNKKGKGVVVQAQGLQAVSITPPALIAAWRDYHMEDAIGFVYQQDGHEFYQLTFPTEDKTWVYDFTTKMWHERRTENARHRAQSYVYFNNMHIVGDYENSNIYELDIATYTDNSEPILRYFTTEHISAERQQMKHNWLELEAEVGVGTLFGQGVSPVITLEISDNGGQTYGNARTIAYGIQGDYEKGIRWPFLGTPRNRVYRVSMSDPVKVRFKRLLLNLPDIPVKGGRSH